MPRILTCFLVAAFLFSSFPAAAQSVAERLAKPPAGVEEQLRERVLAFFALQNQSKFRQAEAMVCEESKDRYYSMDKTAWKSYEIISIRYEDEFKTANVVMSLQSTTIDPRIRFPVKFPIANVWKVEDGKWCNYIPVPKNVQETPFGLMSGGKPEQGEGPRPPRVNMVNPADLINSVKFSKKQLKVKSYEDSTDELEITNGLSGSLSLELDSIPLSGLTCKLSKKELAAGETAKLSVGYKTKDRSPKTPINLNLRMEPLGQNMQVPLSFDIAPEIKEKLPEALRKN